MRYSAREILLNVATGLVTVIAVSLGSVRLYREVRSDSAGHAPQQRHVEHWELIGRVGIRLGPAVAPVTLVEFSDFECAFCKAAIADVRAVRAAHRDDLTFVYRHLPIHKHSFEAAVAAECAARQQAFERFHDTLFAKSDSLGIISWTSLASRAGIADSTQFRHCMSDSAAINAVRRDSVAAVDLGLEGTPSFLVNDVLISGNPGQSLLERTIAQVTHRK